MGEIKFNEQYNLTVGRDRVNGQIMGNSWKFSIKTNNTSPDQFYFIFWKTFVVFKLHFFKDCIIYPLWFY